MRRLIGLFAALALFLPASAAAVRQEMVSSATFTASGNSSTFTISTCDKLFVGVDVTACASTLVATVWLQGSDDGGTTWYDIPADLVLVSANTAATGTLSSAPGQRNIVNTVTCGGSPNLAPADYLGIYKGLPTDKIRLKWITSSTTSFTFSASYVCK